ncbi:hypothetical protein [Larkinella rosea]|uniref:DUF4595 domain-containing protein n=1 Tax=Larkinella rosea TaxID=2025312 RepID=A0A3P1BE67_9BACT|nr:hypothetical protein [Larkinella rosea]RRA99122.1 hypothetical protein EHT25_29560 [Larkinella rosea]
MKLSTPVALLTASFLICLDACKPHLPAQESPPCALLNFRVINKTTDPLLANVREEPLVIDGKSLKVGESTRATFTFDSQNRPISSTFTAYGYSDYNRSETFDYSPAKLTVKTSYPSGGASEATFPLNDKGLVADVKYNADGFAVEENTDSYRTTTTIENGNIVRRETRKVADNSLFSVVRYEYDLNRQNLPNVAPHKGKNSRNLPIKETYLSYSGATGTPVPTTTVYDYSYLFDSNGRPSRRYNKLGDGTGTYEVSEYEYICRQ